MLLATTISAHNKFSLSLGSLSFPVLSSKPIGFLSNLISNTLEYNSFNLL